MVTISDVIGVCVEPREPEFFVIEKEIVHNCLIILSKHHLSRLRGFFEHALLENIIRKGLS